MLFRIALVAATVLLLGPASASATVHIVTQSGTSFSPQDISIALGDTVQWVHSSLSHTVTEGTGGGACSGCAFDSPLTAGNPTYSVVFDSTFVATNPRVGGLYDYYCQPHFGFGMTGTVTVMAPIPTMPVWGLVAFAGLLVSAAARASRR